MKFPVSKFLCHTPRQCDNTDFLINRARLNKMKVRTSNNCTTLHLGSQTNMQMT